LEASTTVVAARTGDPMIMMIATTETAATSRLQLEVRSVVIELTIGCSPAASKQ
jgi:hypothetical protein